MCPKKHRSGQQLAFLIYLRTKKHNLDMTKAPVNPKPCVVDDGIANETEQLVNAPGSLLFPTR